MAFQKKIFTNTDLTILVPYRWMVKKDVFGSGTKGENDYDCSVNELFIRGWGSFWSSN